MIVWFGEAAPPDVVGGKGAALSRATAAGLPVPRGFCVGVDALLRLDEAAPAAQAAAATLSGPVAVRSSAVGEDGVTASFAGIHATVLNVRPAGLRAALETVRDSASSDAARAYRTRRGLAGEPRMAAVVQTMVAPDVSGICFTRDPKSGQERFIIDASWGLGEAIVSGLVTPDHWELDRAGTVLTRQIADKDLAVLPVDGGTAEVEVAADRRSIPSLDAGALAAVVELARACERLFGAGQDIEWAFAQGQLWLLQHRPITTATRA